MFQIRRFEEKDSLECGALIAKVFLKFNKNEGNQETIRSAIDSYDPNVANHEQIKNRFKSSDIVFVAIDNNKIIGVIRGLNNRIQALFLDDKHHGKGIGRDLLNVFEKQAKKNGSKEVKVKSSLYAIDFYKRQGYKKTTGIRMFSGGIKVQPMKKILN